MKQLEVQILQQSYLLGCPEGREARMLEAVKRVDTAMTTIRDAGKVRARERIAVLAALNLAFDLADCETAQQASAAHPPSGAALAAASNDAPPMSSADNARLAALVIRLDDALSSDNQLF